MWLCMMIEMHNYVYAKNGQKWLFSKYSRIIYRWKAYGEVITTFVIFIEIFHF